MALPTMIPCFLWLANIQAKSFLPATKTKRGEGRLGREANSKENKKIRESSLIIFVPFFICLTLAVPLASLW
jgi:hypothetical protein